VLYSTYDEFVHVNVKAIPQSRAVSLPRRGQLLQDIYKFCKKAGHHMKDCMEFLKWLHKKEIPFREG
jgi:hypothetical protein